VKKHRRDQTPELAARDVDQAVAELCGIPTRLQPMSRVTEAEKPHGRAGVLRAEARHDEHHGAERDHGHDQRMPSHARPWPLIAHGHEIPSRSCPAGRLFLQLGARLAEHSPIPGILRIGGKLLQRCLGLRQLVLLADPHLPRVAVAFHHCRDALRDQIGRKPFSSNRIG
jgi:hypothetical protein